MNEDPRRGGLDRWIAFLESLSAESLPQLDALTTPDVRFADPFNDVRGRAGVRRVLDHALRSCSDPRFVIERRGLDGDLGFLRWRFDARAKWIGDFGFNGAAEILLTPEGLVESHVEFWDGGEIYRRMPLLGALVQAVSRRVTAG